MPTEVLKFYRNEGVVRIEILIRNTPTWSYSYIEDQTHLNSNNMGKPLRHTLGEPHELLKSHHQWYFDLINPANVDILIDIEINWIQKVGGQDKVIHSWTEKEFKIKAEDAESIPGKIVLFPI